VHRFAAFLYLITFGVCLADEVEPRPQDFEHFERKIRPLLVKHCYACHSLEAKTVHGGLRLDSAAALEQGGDSGAVVDGTHLSESLLLEAIRYDGDIQMPPKGKLAPAEIAEFALWVESGAPMPPTTEMSERVAGHIDFSAGRSFWSFQPALAQSEPRVEATAWPQSRIDLFVLAALERQQLEPSPQADRTTLIRRLFFDLLGIPPTPEQVYEFVNDSSPQAYENLVESLLQSPRYGEKWARHWLDLARYTDKTAEWLYTTGQAHLYRDWVVQAFNDDMPYDDFIHRQLATDLMPETGPEDLPALGFISLSPTYWKELKLPCEIINAIVADEWEERVDATSRTFLGLTVACARCHDHKFDPISSEDYYAFAGVFASCRQVERPLLTEVEYEPVAKAKQEVLKLEAEIAELKKQKPQPQEQIVGLEEKVAAIKFSTPLYDTPMANVVSEESLYVVRAGATPQDGTRLEYRPEPRDLPLYIRGDPNRPGPIVPRRFLTVLTEPSNEESQSKLFNHGSGRLELAQAITSDAASLAARVMVNRVWLAHFGRGLVATPSDFGQQGSRPTHPELLDDLAARFIANGWSIKQLHREILLSATWQQSSAFDQAKAHVDPDNRWLSRMNRQRLSFEAWRDAMLTSTGTLDTAIGGSSLELDEAENHRRTIYATVHRRDMSTTLTSHDFPDPNQHSPGRIATTTALQGLYALNGPLLAGQANALSERLQREIADDDVARIDRAYELLYSRAATATEQRLCLEFLGDATDEEREARWKQFAQVLLAANELLFVD
jgi:hypothetical protein